MDNFVGQLTQELKQPVVMIVLSVFIAIATMPLELLKLQHQTGTYQANGFFNFMTSSYSKVGWILLLATVYHSISFFGVIGAGSLRGKIENLFTKLLVKEKDKNKYSSYTFFSNLVFVFLGLWIPLLVSYPLNTFRTLLLAQTDRSTQSVFDSIEFSALYGGIGYASMGVFVCSLLFLFLQNLVVDPVQEEIEKEKGREGLQYVSPYVLGDNKETKWISVVIIAMITAFCYYPFDTARTRLMLGGTSNGSLHDGAVVGIVDTTAKVFFPMFCLLCVEYK